MAEKGLEQEVEPWDFDMKLSEFDYDLPEELIATKPLENRDESRLLVYNKGNISDSFFKQLPKFLNKNDVLVLNDTKVMPARLEGKCENKKVEITLLKKQISDDEIWQVLANPAKRLQIGKNYVISNDFYSEILRKNQDGSVIIKFNCKDSEFISKLEKYGSMPLPPYISKKRKADYSDKNSYQTIYANNLKLGSVAAPTAGLHFTKKLLSELIDKGINIAFVTLHVGAGTFLPVRTENILDHKMHSEFFEIDKCEAEKINQAKKSGGRIIAVGTTSLRTLESSSSENGRIKDGMGETDIFIYPGYQFKSADMLITNFHLPKSTLFMLVSAFVGIEAAKKIYSHAIKNKYHFFSYGDSSLLMRDKIVP